MDDLYQYPVFFESHSPLGEHRRRIEAYFRVRRRSGGGECGPLTIVQDNIYSIAFRNQKDQQAVLDRSTHDVQLVDGHLALTVRGSLQPRTSLPVTTSTSPAESPQSTPAATAPPLSAEYKLQLDSQTADEVKMYSEAWMDDVSWERSQLLGVEDRSLPFLSLSEGNTIVASYNLCDGLQVLVCRGDITKQCADVLVNAANEDLDHCGGVAAALSKAGGPEVQRESNAIIKDVGKIHTGDAVVTTGGNLNCKKLLHVVGPVLGEAGGRERILLEKAVLSVLDLSEMMELQSIAIPCISSGVFGVPVAVCCEAIVTAVKKFGSQAGRSLSTIILIDNREEVVRAMYETCDRLLQGTSTGTPSDVEFQMDAAGQDTARGATASAPGGGVRVEIVQGTIETQQVDAVVSPMDGHNPLTTRIGNTLNEMTGYQLSGRFRQEAGDETIPGDSVLVEGLPGLPSNAVFFLSLVPWDDDQSGTSVEILRLGINQILTSCDSRGFGSVALPVLGAGIALRFPDTVIARVLLEEVHKFERDRARSTPLCVRIVIHPNDEEAREAFMSVQEALENERLAEAVQQDQDHVSSTRRVVLLGKTGYGKSNLANTILGEGLFTTYLSSNSGTRTCQAETKRVNGRSITLIDTPGFFDSDRPEVDLKAEIVRCMTQCSPGPHAFLIVLKVETFTEQEQAVITKICQYFSEDALKYAVIVFTRGDQLPEGMTIEEFVSQNKNLRDLVQKCGGRCHVVDNTYWNNGQQTGYRSNQFQVEALLRTIDRMVMEKRGGYYTNRVLQQVEEEIQMQEWHIRDTSGHLPPEEIRRQAQTRVSNQFLIRLAGTTTGAVLGAFFGVAVMVGVVITAVKNIELIKHLKMVAALGGAGAAVAAGEAVAAGGAGAAVAAGEAVAAGGAGAAGAAGGAGAAGAAGGVGTVALTVVGAAVGLAAAGGGIIGGAIGYEAAEGARTPLEAAKRAARVIVEGGQDVWKKYK